MKSFKIKSYAKINLALNVIGKNTKLHKIESIIAFINLHDLLYFHVFSGLCMILRIRLLGKYSNNLLGILLVQYITR